LVVSYCTATWEFLDQERSPWQSKEQWIDCLQPRPSSK
jgi:hypothetical protein